MLKYFLTDLFSIMKVQFGKKETPLEIAEIIPSSKWNGEVFGFSSGWMINLLQIVFMYAYKMSILTDKDAFSNHHFFLNRIPFDLSSSFISCSTNTFGPLLIPPPLSDHRLILILIMKSVRFPSTNQIWILLPGFVDRLTIVYRDSTGWFKVNESFSIARNVSTIDWKNTQYLHLVLPLLSHIMKDTVC